MTYEVRHGKRLKYHEARSMTLGENIKNEIGSRKAGVEEEDVQHRLGNEAFFRGNTIKDYQSNKKKKDWICG